MGYRPRKRRGMVVAGAVLALLVAVALAAVALRGDPAPRLDTVNQLDDEAAIALPTFAPASSAASATGGVKQTTTRAIATTRGAATTRLRDEAGLVVVTVAQLPQEAQRVLQLIDKGGPFDYDRDGVTFENREGLLPKQVKGYYKEYTVKTPGESDRGARRIVAGQKGERYYTADHYDSFVRIQR